MDDFQKKYHQYLNDIAGIEGTAVGDRYCSNVELSIEEAIQALSNEAERRRNVDVHYLKGWLSEQWHAETFKIHKQVVGNKDVWATVPRNNTTGEDIIFGGNDYYRKAELKYYRSETETSKAISQPGYIDKEKIVPSDQLDGVRRSSQNSADKLGSYRPDQAKNYQDTANRASDRISTEDVSSKPLSEPKAREMAKDFKKDGGIDADKYNLNSESFIEWTDIARESGKAAMHAAILSAALQTAPHVWQILKELIDKGDVDIKELKTRGLSVLKGSSTAAVRGGVAASVTASFKSGLLGKFVKDISPSAIGIATTMIINSIDYSLQLYRDEIAKHQFANFCVKDSMILTTALIGASVGQLIIPIPLLGALVGNVVGGLLGNVVYEKSNGAMLGLGIENGWTFFGLVQQDYTVSEEVLEICGYDIFQTNYFEPEPYKSEEFEIEQFIAEEYQVDTLTGNQISFVPLKRGIIGINIVGYV